MNFRHAFSLVIILTVSLGACAVENTKIELAVESVTLMTFNAQNLFDNKDDPEKDDKAYLPIENKRHEPHIHACNEIEV